MIARFLSPYVSRDATYYPVLTVTGPRQSGKTTLVRSVFSAHDYVSLEDMDMRRLAVDDPRAFLARYPGPVVIDEAQRAPDLFSYIQSAVDADPAPARFVLSGSQNFLLMERISQSLAGRSAILHLMPFQRAEVEAAAAAPEHDDSGSAAAADAVAFPAVPRIDPATLFTNRATALSLWDTIFRGFYPRVVTGGIPPEVWHSDYIQTYVERDVRALLQIGERDRFERFMALAAGRIGQLVNYSSLASDAGISVDTARRWISVLATSFLVFLLPPHHRNLNKRVIKTPKLYFYDTGLACRLLNIRTAEQIQDHPLRGALFENLIVAELAKHFEHSRQRPPLYFWRDRTGHEVDLLIEDGDSLFPIEIKSGRTIQPDMLKGVQWWCSEAGQDPSTATLIHAGDAWHSYHGVAVRPWYAV